MRQFHQPVWLGGIGRAGTPAFAVLFTLDTMVRASVVTVVPLKALAMLGDAGGVSVLYFLVSGAGLIASLAIPWLTRHLRRRWALTLGAGSLIVGAVLLAGATLPGLVVGLGMQMFGAACVSVCLNLYVMDHIPRDSYTRFEPMRMLFGGMGWTVAPIMGVWLGRSVAPWAPYAASAGFGLMLLAAFWFLRLSESPAVARGSAPPPPNPVLFLRRFFAQPRLVLAWVLAVGRAGWWGMFFIYTPIFAVQSGLGEIAGGLIVSAGSASMFAVTLWGWVGRRYGLRRLLVCGYVATGVLTMAVGVVAGNPWAGAAMLIAAAAAAGTIDGAGNVPYLRAVRPRERPEMTTVYSSYRDVARLLTPGLYALLLQVFALPVVFTSSGVIMLVLARYARLIPKRL